jgi:cyclopropane-fatty-acyl-phospholipid synthase
MWILLLDRFLKKLVRTGGLTVVWPDGRQTHYGSGPTTATVRMTDRATPRRLLLKPELALGEAYMDGTLTVDGDDLHGLLGMLADNAKGIGMGRFNTIIPGARHALKRFSQNNTRRNSRANVEHHYDLSVDLYQLFLDADLQYTCAHYSSDNMSIEVAQDTKKALIARKLLIEPGMRVLDIGCGWGGLSITLARDYGARVVGVTLSKVQLEHARKRAEAAGVADRVEFRLIDYRDIHEHFDRIVVVGMLEHVGQPQFATFFAKMFENLHPDGVALVHTIGRSTPPGLTAPFIDKYIFPGCYIPSMSEILRETERNRLVVTDVEVWRLHYAKTLRAWKDKFETNLDAIRALYDDRFTRMWRYYLVAGEIGFTHLDNVIFHFQLARNKTAVPITRDYLYNGGP